MKLGEIKTAVLSGKTVCVGCDSYKVSIDAIGQWLIIHDGGYCIGLTWKDGKTLNAREEEFYIVKGHQCFKGRIESGN